MAGNEENRSKGKSVGSSTDELLAQLEQLTRPSFLTDLKGQIAELARPSYLADLQSQMARVTQPSYLADLQSQMARVTQPSYLADLQSQMAGVTQLSYLADLQLQMARVTQPSYLADLQSQMAKLTQPSYLTELRKQMAGLARPSYLADLQSQVAAMSSGTRLQAELAAVVGSYQGLINGSSLASYLIRLDDGDEAHVMGVERFDSIEVGDFADLEVEPLRSVDLEIVKAISDGEVAKLSSTAMQRLQSVYLQIVAFWDILLRIFNTYTAIAFFSTLLSASSLPADIPLQAASLNNEQRELLSDYRVVNREGARLRAEPTTQSKAITSLPFAHLVEVIEYNDKGWYRVVAETPEGYLEGWVYVSVTTPIPKPKRLSGQNVDDDAT
jgi:hypothetical protein